MNIFDFSGFFKNIIYLFLSNSISFYTVNAWNYNTNRNNITENFLCKCLSNSTFLESRVWTAINKKQKYSSLLDHQFAKNGLSVKAGVGNQGTEWGESGWECGQSGWECAEYGWESGKYGWECCE